MLDREGSNDVPSAGLRIMAQVLCCLLALILGPVTAVPARPSANLDDMKRAGFEGRYEDAVQIGRALLAELETRGEGSSLEAAVVIDHLVFLMIRSGKVPLPESLALAQRGLSIREKSLGSADPGLAKGLATLGIVLHRTGRFAEARRQYERALMILEKVPDAGRQLAEARVNLANLLADSGDYAGARMYYEETIRSYEATRKPDDPGLGVVLNLLGLVLANLGDLELSRATLERAQGILEKALGPDNPDFTSVLDNLATTLAAMGDDATAKQLWTRAIRIQEVKLGKDNRRLAGPLNNLAGVLIRDGEIDSAQEVLERALRIWETSLGPQHPANAHALSGLGDVHVARSEFAEARSFYERALRIREQSLGPDHPLTAESLIELARVRLIAGDRLAALEGALRAESILGGQVRRVARRLSDRQALEYEALAASGLDLAESAMAAGVDSGAVPGAPISQVWEALIRSRDRILDEMAARHRTLLEHPSPTATRLYEELESSRADYAGTVLAGPGESGDFQQRLRSAQERVDRAEQTLAERSLDFRRDYDRSSAGFADVARALPRGTRLLAFSRYNRTTPGRVESEPSYVAYVLASSGEPPRAVLLGSSKEIDSRIEEWRRQAGTLPTDEEALARYRTVGTALRKLLWDPVAGRLEGSQRVLVVPDGDIHLVNFATLPMGSKGYLLEKGPTLHYVSAERDLVGMRSVPPAGVGLLALGGVDFDQPPPTVVEEMAALRTADDSRSADGVAATTATVFRGVRPRCNDLQAPRFSMLPSSKSEAQDVVELWRSRHPAELPDSVLLLTGNQAGEGVFKRLAPRKRVLHLSTHAVWIGGCDPAQSGGAPALRLQISGLALAGANRNYGPDGGPDGEDGILTAEEVASLDLRGVEWVVLSGCGTGVGPVMRGEGILGLRRTFTIAGAQTLLMSLWPVTDHDAREWIEELYRARLRGRSTADAVRDGSLAILDSRRRAGVSTHPFFWGAFVAAGNWQ